MTADTTDLTAQPMQPSLRRLIVAATIGNIFEWFDFVVYGFFAVTIAEVFFRPATRRLRC
jgi:MHS family proline/betaine transporter-like MFS transporter